MKLTLQDINLKNKNVILRCDFNVSIKNNQIIDDTRIKESLKTIKYLQENCNKLIIISHLGKIKSEADKEKYSMSIVADRLNDYLDNKVEFESSLDFDLIKIHLSNLSEGKVLLLQNTRYYDLNNKQESNCDMKLAKNYASLADIFINDAFGTIHRKHASNYGISKLLPTGIGFLIEKEISNLDKLKNPKRPYAIIMGGAKVSDKTKLINKLITQVDQLYIGGAMANTFLKAIGYNIGKSYYEAELIPYCKKIYKKNTKKIYLPVDFTGVENNVFKTYDLENIPDDFDIFDIGQSTINTWGKSLKDINTLFWNGPVGKYEEVNFQNGTTRLLEIITNNIETTILGGGDMISASQILGFKDKVTFASTGGGATLSYLENPKQPGLINIKEKK